MAKVDLHIHSNHSDGSDSIKVLAENIKQAKIDIFALTDHDTIEGCLEMSREISPEIKFIPSIELTCKADDIKCHLLGYNCNPHDEILNKLIQKGKVLRKNKLETRIQYLKTQWGITLTEDEKEWLYSRKSVVKTHIANILVNRGLAKDNLSAMAKYLDGCKSGDTRFGGEEAIFAIKASGGIPVWAHPLGGEGEKHLSQKEFLPKLNKMLKFGIKGLECYYSRYSKEEISFLLECCEQHNLLISGGSDYHGTNKDIPLLKLNTNNTPIESENLSIIKEIL